MNKFHLRARIVFIFSTIVSVFFTGWAQTDLNLTTPPAIASIFGKGVVSDQFGNRDMAISPDGQDFFYTLQYRGGFGLSVIMHSKLSKGKWTKPEVAFFSGQYSDLEPAFSPDGQRLYFVSNRPIDGNPKKDFDIWYVSKNNNKWSHPVRLDAPVNTEKNEFYPSIARSGNIYFTREMPGSDEDIVFCRFNNMSYDTAQSLPDEINSAGGEFNAFVDPDEKYIIYTAYKRKGNIGTGDLYISFKDSIGSWKESVNMGQKINGNGLTYCPYISPDRKCFFYSSSKAMFTFPFERPMKIDEIKAMLDSASNGWDNIYWIQAKEWINQ